MRYLEDESTYILGVFDTGDTVTIDVYKLSDDSKVVDAAACSEIAATGTFKYSFSQAIATKTEYEWVMTNGDYDQRGKIILGGYPDGIKDKTDNLPASPAPAGEYDTQINRLLGLAQENVYIDQPSFDSDDNLISARLRIYSDPASVGTDNDVLATYTITAVGDGKGKFTYWKQVKQ